MGTRTLMGTASSGITESFQSIASLMPDDLPAVFEAATLRNTGDTDLKIAALVADDAHSNTLKINKSIYLPGANLANTYVRTLDDTGENVLEFTGNTE